MSESPCSVPDWLRFLLPLETPRQQAACRRHDARYARGGDRRARLVTDLCFALDLMGADPWNLQVIVADLETDRDGAMDPDRAEQYYYGVRQYGGDPNHWSGGDDPGAQPLRPPEAPQSP